MTKMTTVAERAMTWPNSPGETPGGGGRPGRGADLDWPATSPRPRYVAFLMRLPRDIDDRLQELRWAFRKRSRQQIVREAVAEWADRREATLLQEAHLEQSLRGRTLLQATQAELRAEMRKKLPKRWKRASSEAQLAALKKARAVQAARRGLRALTEPGPAAGP
jgi:predicted transcriptional regulator